MNEHWFQQKEQSAGRFRMMFMWYVYRFLGKDVQKILGFFVVLFVYPFAKAGRAATNDFKRVFNGYAAAHRLPPARFSTFGHLLSFAWSMMDKTDACSLRKNLPTMTVRDDEDWRAFKSLLAAKRGAFLISTHLGTIEVLPAAYASGLTPEHPVVHAFQQLGHDAVFTKVFLDHFRGGDVILHPTEEIGVETAAAMQEAIGRGELVLMAGDRLSAGSPDAKLRHDFLDRPCVWPKGVFVFAKLMESPVFFVTCVKTGWNAYEAHFEFFDNAEAQSRREVGRAVPREPQVEGRAFSSSEACVLKPSTSSLLSSYVRFLEHETIARPDQWFQFYRFFG